MSRPAPPRAASGPRPRFRQTEDSSELRARSGSASGSSGLPALPILLRALAPLILLLGLGRPAPAQSEAPVALSWLHARLLERSPTIVRARYSGPVRLPDGKAGRFDVLEVLRAPARAPVGPGARVVVTRLAPQALARTDLEKVLFLRPGRSRSLAMAVDVVDLFPEEASEQVALLRSYLALGEEPLSVRRQDRMGEIVLDGLLEGGPWRRRVVTHELGFQLEQDPTFLGVEALAPVLPRLESFEPKTAALLLAHLRKVATGPEFARAMARAEERATLDARRQISDVAPGPERWRQLERLFERHRIHLVPYLIEMLDGEDRSTGDRCARLLGEIGDARAFEPLLASWDGLPEGSLRARLRALGELGDARARRRLQEYARHPRLADAALEALAVLDDPEALAFLRAQSEREDLDQARRRLFEKLLAPEWRALQRRRLAARRAYARSRAR